MRFLCSSELTFVIAFLAADAENDDIIFDIISKNIALTIINKEVG